MLVALNENNRRIGETHHRAKLSDEIVQVIRNMHYDRGLSYGVIARVLKLNKRTVIKICRYEIRAQVAEKWITV